MSKIKVAVIFGGTNTEHEVSLVSASAVINNLSKDKYEIIPIKITKENSWITPAELQASYNPVKGQKLITAEKFIYSINNILVANQIDVVFPVLHGPYGEDGTIQGLFELMRIPYVGCGVAASAICMDKILQKNICEAYDIPVVPYSWFTKQEWLKDKSLVTNNIVQTLGKKYPFFVKPANQGSSVGITKAHNEQELIAGIELALTRDLKVIVERGVSNIKELECSILGTTEDPSASVLGEVIPSGEFYDFESKYINQGSSSIIPAKIENDLTISIQETAKKAFKVLNCYGLARVDFLLDSKTNKYYLNELNTLPGFTPISMYPKLWEASNLSYPALLDKLIELALKLFQEKKELNHSR